MTERKILNLGCGDSLYGTDRIDMFKTKSTTKVANINKGLPYPNDYFDEIYCKSVLEHVRNLGTFVDECYRVLKKNGKIWIRTDHAGFVLAYLWSKHEPNRGLDIQYRAGGFGHEGKRGDLEDHHYMLFVASHLKYLFNQFREHRFNYIYGGSNFLERFIFRILPRNIGACHIEMSALK